MREMLSTFNPHEITEPTLRAVTTGREASLYEILRVIRANLSSANMQHMIVVAPRGYGKSFLMRHIEIEVRRIANEENEPLAVLLMPEEMPFVRQPETLIHELIRVLSGGAASNAKLSWSEDEDTAFEAATRELQEAIQSKLGPNGLCVALIENFDLLLKKAFPKESQILKLRAFLSSSESRLMLVAASSNGSIDQNYDSSFFHAFNEISLEPWSVDECLAFFDRHRKVAGKAPFSDLERARAKAIASFIGGIPRLATLLGEVLLDQDILRAADLLHSLIDELTPYYKERIDTLPGRSQLLLDALLRGGEPATQSELAKRVGAPAQSAIAGPFKDLIREQIVIGEKATGSSEVLYRVADRVFAHFYRFRVIDHGKGLCPLEALVELLTVFFGPTEKRGKASEFLRLGLIDEARIMAKLADADQGQTQAQRQTIIRRLEIYYAPNRLMPMVGERVAEGLRAAILLLRSRRIDEVRCSIDKLFAAELCLEERIALLLFRSRLDAYEGIEAGLMAAEEARIIAEQGSVKLRLMVDNSICWSLASLSRHEEAVVKAQLVADLASENGYKDEEIVARRLEAFSLGQLRRHEEAVVEARRAAELANELRDKSEEIVARRYCAFSLGQLLRHSEAVLEARRAADLAQETIDKEEEAVARRRLAFSLGQLARHEEAVFEAGRAADLAQDIGDKSEEAVARRRLAFILGQLSRHEEAVVEAKRAAELAQEIGDKEEEAISRQRVAFSLGQLSRYDEAFHEAWLSAELANEIRNVELEVIAKRRMSYSLGQLSDHARSFVELASAAHLCTAYKLKMDITSFTDQAFELGQIAFIDANEKLNEIATLHIVTNNMKTNIVSDIAGLEYMVMMFWLQGYVNLAIQHKTSPSELDSLSDAIAVHFSNHFSDLRAKLNNAADYHRAGRSRSALERMDPDFSRVLAITHPPEEEDASASETTKGSWKSGHTQKKQNPKNVKH